MQTQHLFGLSLDKENVFNIILKDKRFNDEEKAEIENWRENKCDHLFDRFIEEQMWETHFELPEKFEYQDNVEIGPTFSNGVLLPIISVFEEDKILYFCVLFDSFFSESGEEVTYHLKFQYMHEAEKIMNKFIGKNVDKLFEYNVEVEPKLYCRMSKL